MKIVELFGNALLTGTSTWALMTTNSTFRYDRASYVFFLSIGVTGIMANLTNNKRLTYYTKTLSQDSLAFATALISVETCLSAQMDVLLAYSNLIIPVCFAMTKGKNKEYIYEAGIWYNAVLVNIATIPYCLKLGQMLTLTLTLTNIRQNPLSSYLMAASIMLAVPCLRLLNNV